MLINRSEIIEFFIVFSRFEYSLKAEGYLENNRNAKANWISFAEKIEHKNYERLEDNDFSTSFNYILDNPPKAQINIDDHIEWENRPASQGSRVKDLFVYIKRIRNNLFHGGKFTNGILEEFDRDLLLVKHGLKILKSSIELDSNIRNTYYYNFNLKI